MKPLFRISLNFIYSLFKVGLNNKFDLLFRFNVILLVHRDTQFQDGGSQWEVRGFNQWMDGMKRAEGRKHNDTF